MNRHISNLIRDGINSFDQLENYIVELESDKDKMSDEITALTDKVEELETLISELQDQLNQK